MEASRAGWDRREITRIEGMKYAFRHFEGPDGRVYGINEQK